MSKLLNILSHNIILISLCTLLTAPFALGNLGCSSAAPPSEELYDDEEESDENSENGEERDPDENKDEEDEEDEKLDAAAEDEEDEEENEKLDAATEDEEQEDAAGKEKPEPDAAPPAPKIEFPEGTVVCTKPAPTKPSFVAGADWKDLLAARKAISVDAESFCGCLTKYDGSCWAFGSMSKCKSEFAKMSPEQVCCRSQQCSAARGGKFVTGFPPGLKIQPKTNATDNELISVMKQNQAAHNEACGNAVGETATEGFEACGGAPKWEFQKPVGSAGAYCSQSGMAVEKGDNGAFHVSCADFCKCFYDSDFTNTAGGNCEPFESVKFCNAYCETKLYDDTLCCRGKRCTEAKRQYDGTPVKGFRPPDNWAGSSGRHHDLCNVAVGATETFEGKSFPSCDGAPTFPNI